MNDIINIDEASSDFKITENMLKGRDDFCMEFITYCRERMNGKN
jgi:hypothetical protein